MTCPQCGAPLADGVTKCNYCGEPVPQAASQQPPQPAYQQPPVYQQQQPVYQQPQMYQQQMNDGIDPAWPIKSKITAGVLALILGGLGIHKFYLGNVGMGILYLLFCWTYIPCIIGLIEGIIYLTSNDHNFQIKHKVRLQ